LFVIGAILRFALNFQTEFIDLALVGNILMVAGAVVFVIGLVLMVRKRRSVTTVSNRVDPATGSKTTEQSTAATGDDVV
jgi:hypothetical protein